MDRWLPHLDFLAAFVAIAISIYALYAQRASENRQRVFSSRQRKLAVLIAIVSEMGILHSTVRRELLAAKKSLENGEFVPPSAAPTFAILKIEDERLTREMLAADRTLSANKLGDQLFSSRIEIVEDRWLNLANIATASDQHLIAQAKSRLAKAIGDLVGQLDTEIEINAHLKSEWAG